MAGYFWPIALVILSNVAYHIVAKSTPQNANPLVSLTVTYLTALAASVALFFLSGPQKGFIASVRELNWTSVALGIAIIGLEFGYIMAYRLGANVSTGPMISYIVLSLLLIPVGMLLYHEHVSYSQLIGIAFCIAGLFLIYQ